MIVEVIHIRTYGGLNPMVIPSFPAELHPSAESVFDSPEIIQTTQLFLQLVVCFNSPKPFPMWLRDSSPFSIKNYPTIGMGFPKSWGYQEKPSRS